MIFNVTLVNMVLILLKRLTAEMLILEWRGLFRYSSHALGFFYDETWSL